MYRILISQVRSRRACNTLQGVLRESRLRGTSISSTQRTIMRDGPIFISLRRVVACASFSISILGVACSDASCPSGTNEVGGRCVKPEGMKDSANDQSSGAGVESGAGMSSAAPTPGGPQAGVQASLAGSDGNSVAGSSGRAHAQAGTAGEPLGSAGSGTGVQAGSGEAAAQGGADGSDPSAAAPEGDPVCAGRRGEYVCAGALLHQCDSAGTSLQQIECTSEARCLAGAASGMCGSCEPGEVQCVGMELQICSMQGVFETRETCQSAALCSTSTQSCTPGQCNAGQFSCANGSLSRCKAELTGFEPMQMCRPELCDADAGKCNDCVPGSARCESNTLLECSESGTFTRRTCSGATPRCVGETCVQCAAASDCDAVECRVATCDRATGTCAAATPSPAGTRCGTDRVCNGEGSCVECVGDDDCEAHETCADRMCRAREPFEAGTLQAGYQVTLSPGYSFKLRAVYSPGNIGRRPVEVSGAAGCPRIGERNPPSSDPSQPINPGPSAPGECTIAASTQSRMITLRGTSQSSGSNTATNTQPCPDNKRIIISNGMLTLGFEDYPEAVLSVADCRDPQIVIDPMP